MHIVVCVKQICHIYARTGRDPDRAFLSPSDKVFIINPYDEGALGIALDIKGQKEGVTISLLTLGPIVAEEELRRCLALGADNLYQVDVGEGLDSRAKSLILARTIEPMGADMVFCGRESLDRQNGLLGALLAHRLGLPFLSAIRDLRLSGEGQVRVQRAAGRGIREVIECPLPALFTVDKEIQEALLPTHENKLKARSARIEKIAFRNSMPANRITHGGVYPPRPRPKRVPAPDSGLEAFYRIEKLLSGSLIEKKGLVLRGDPRSQAEAIASFLEEHGFLGREKTEEGKGDYDI